MIGKIETHFKNNKIIITKMDFSLFKEMLFKQDEKFYIYKYKSE